MAFSFGRHLKISIFGQSHSEAIGVTCEGLPAGTPIDEEDLYDFLRRRAPGQSLTSPRLESDRPRFITGVSGGKTDVGIYSATASGQGANYTLKNSSVQFEITQKEIFIVWEDKTSFTLGDDICYPVATADDGAAQSTLTYKITDADGYTVENITVAGEYKVTVSVGANYKISVSSETEKTFTVNEVLEGEL